MANSVVLSGLVKDVTPETVRYEIELPNGQFMEVDSVLDKKILEEIEKALEDSELLISLYGFLVPNQTKELSFLPEKVSLRKLSKTLRN